MVGFNTDYGNIIWIDFNDFKLFLDNIMKNENSLYIRILSSSCIRSLKAGAVKSIKAF